MGGPIELVYPSQQFVEAAAVMASWIDMDDSKAKITDDVCIHGIGL